MLALTHSVSCSETGGGPEKIQVVLGAVRFIKNLTVLVLMSRTKRKALDEVIGLRARASGVSLELGGCGNLGVHD